MLYGLHQVNPLPKLSLIYTLKWQPQTKGKRGTLPTQSLFLHMPNSQAGLGKSFLPQQHLGGAAVLPSSQGRRSCPLDARELQGGVQWVMASPPHPAGLDPSSALLPATDGFCRQGGLSWRHPWSQHLQHSTGKSQLRGSASAPEQWLRSCSHPCGIPDLIQGSVLLTSSEIMSSMDQLSLLWLFQPLIRLSPLPRGSEPAMQGSAPAAPAARSSTLERTGNPVDGYGGFHGNLWPLG